MSRAVRALAVPAVLGAAAAVGAVVAGLASRGQAADAWILFVGALVLARLVRATRTASGADEPSSYERALRRPAARAPVRPGALEKLEREVVLSSANAFDLHVRLRPRLRLIARHLLRTRRGLALDGTPAVREALGDELWELVRPDRPTPADRQAPGLPLARQRAALDRLERL